MGASQICPPLSDGCIPSLLDGNTVLQDSDRTVFGDGALRFESAICPLAALLWSDRF